MHVFQTCGVPPSLGRMVLPTMGCTRKRMKALTNSVMAKRGRAKGRPPGNTILMGRASWPVLYKTTTAMLSVKGNTARRRTCGRLWKQAGNANRAGGTYLNYAVPMRIVVGNDEQKA